MLVVGIFGPFLILKYPTVGFALMFFLIPLGPLSRRIIDAERASTFMLGALLLGIYASKVLILREKIKFDRISLLGCAFVGWAIVSSVWAYKPESALSQAVLRLSQMIGLYILVLNYCRGERQLNILTLSFIAGAVAASVLTIFGGGGGGTFGETERARLTLSYNPNAFSRILGLAVILAFYCFYKAKPKFIKIIFLLGVMIMLYVIFRSQSRTVWAAFPISFLIAAAILYRNTKIIRYTAKVAFTLGIIVILAYFSGIISESSTERFKSLSYLFSDDTAVKVTSRGDVWKVGLEMIMETMPLGVGFGNYKSAFNEYGYAIDYTIGPKGAHNTYLAILAETGLIGFAIFTVIFIHLYRSIRRIRDFRTLFIYTWLFVFFMIGNLTGTYHIMPWFWFALFLISFQGRLENHMPRHWPQGGAFKSGGLDLEYKRVR